MRWLGSRAVASSSGGWLVKWLFPHLNHPHHPHPHHHHHHHHHPPPSSESQGLGDGDGGGGGGGGHDYRDPTHAPASASHDSSSSPGASPSPGAGAGGGGHQWRDLEGVLVDAMMEFLRPLQMMVKIRKSIVPYKIYSTQTTTISYNAIQLTIQSTLP